MVAILIPAAAGKPTREARGCWPWGRGAAITPLLLDQPTLASCLCPPPLLSASSVLYVYFI